jgi:hypothetical protein
MPSSLFALGMGIYLGAAAVVIVLFGIFLVPYLIKEIGTGKAELGPVRHLVGGGKVVLGPPAPPGAGDNNPGRRGDPAPGMPDGQADPWGPRAQREAPPIKS